MKKKSVKNKSLLDIKAILNYLSSYPDVLEEMEIKQLLKPEEVLQQYKDWKYLVSQYTGLEKDFYKESWFPIQFDDYQFFIDISKSEYPIIETMYIMGEKNKEEYISSILFESVTQFLLLIEDRQKLSQYFEKHLMLKYFNYIDDFDLKDDPFGEHF